MSLKEIESLVNNFPKPKAPDRDGIIGEFNQTFTKYFVSIFYNLFQKIQTEGILPNLFYKATITLISKTDKKITRAVNFRPTSLINIDAKILTKY